MDVPKIIGVLLLVAALLALAAVIDGVLLQAIWNGFVVHHVNGATRTSFKHAIWPGAFIACLCGAYTLAGRSRK